VVRVCVRRHGRVERYDTEAPEISDDAGPGITLARVDEHRLAPRRPDQDRVALANVEDADRQGSARGAAQGVGRGRRGENGCRTRRGHSRHRGRRGGRARRGGARAINGGGAPDGEKRDHEQTDEEDLHVSLA